MDKSVQVAWDLSHGPPETNMDSEQKPAQQYQHVAPSQNPAVALCYESYTRALEEAAELRMFRNQAYTAARMVYQKAMPPLVGRENI